MATRLSGFSIPGGGAFLWLSLLLEGERMNNYEYQPPYYFGSTSSYEPNGVPDHDGSLMPDYNAFCLDCHANPDVYSTALGRNLDAIDWGPKGDIHGGSPRYAQQYVPGATLRPPYDTSAGGTSPNYVLSCTDCHESHGTVLKELAARLEAFDHRALLIAFPCICYSHLAVLLLRFRAHTCQSI